ncbi:DUF2637 domain-containing protein [Streptomyces sp. NPDC005708]|uniref:DUF2637 domain-containing protein n=1 Tax=Streptomyces sp. NPDC005708 TaxID=3154564 RepID=UPI003402FDC7
MPKLFRTRKGRTQKPLNDSGVPPLTGAEKWLAAFASVGAAAVGGIGLASSFDAVSAAAESWGFSQPWMLPGGIDSAIPIFTVANLMLIRMDMRLGWVRLVPWVLTLVTCALNIAAGISFWGKVAHGTMPLLWVAFSEIAAHIYAVRIGAVTGRRMDNVRWARWFLDPVPTFLLWRRMRLWELRSYDQVLKLEQERLVYRAQLRARFGRAWRRKAPVEALLPLKLVRHGVPLQETVSAGLAAAGIEAAAPVALPEAKQFEQPAPAVVPAAAARRPRPQVTATVPAQAQAPVVEETAALAEEPVDELAAEPTTEAVTENELYEVVVAALRAGEAERFEQGGDLTGAGMGRILQQSAGNGRKVRMRILTRYAAHLSDQGIAVPENFTVADLMTTAGV